MGRDNGESIASDYSGLMDELRIYGRALSASEIEYLFLNIPTLTKPLSYSSPSLGKRHHSDAQHFKNHYYMKFEDKVDWFEARRRCRELGGYLATVSIGVIHVCL